MTLAGTGVYAAHVPLHVWIGSGGPDTQPDAIAELYWTLHTTRAEAEHLYTLSPATPHGTGSGVAAPPMYGSTSTAPSSRMPPG
jgi:hypothetical protein